LNLISGLGSDVDSKRKCAASKRRCKEVEETKDKSEQSAFDALRSRRKRSPRLPSSRKEKSSVRAFSLSGIKLKDQRDSRSQAPSNKLKRDK
jgi:hypothetical protein